MKRYQEEKVSRLIPTRWRSPRKPSNDKAVYPDHQDAGDDVSGGGYEVCLAIIRGFAERAFAPLTRLRATTNRWVAPNPQRSVHSHPRFPHENRCTQIHCDIRLDAVREERSDGAKVYADAIEQATIGVLRSHSSNNTGGCVLAN